MGINYGFQSGLKLEIWNLEFVWDLGLGIWDLNLIATHYLVFSVRAHDGEMNDYHIERNPVIVRPIQKARAVSDKIPSPKSQTNFKFKIPNPKQFQHREYQGGVIQRDRPMAG